MQSWGPTFAVIAVNVITAAFLYGKLVTTVQNHEKLLDQHDKSIDDHEKRLTRIEAKDKVLGIQ